MMSSDMMSLVTRKSERKITGLVHILLTTEIYDFGLKKLKKWSKNSIRHPRIKPYGQIMKKLIQGSNF